ncbi:hypothetical protein B0T24DRAFT_600715 [Lasiosphaeria ovina]|uniref:FAD-containing monooxygenase EthA n=1 Tax=Lasiosphaeria ovina TaxID=92902 RepID=A0AAE0TWK5_9PEZI|nr:hypothetical protein B0T24DRAFT_600715 [Lasiosphaeria ovina]
MESKTAFDVLVVGAGLSGINTAYRLQTQLPGRSFAVLESRDAMGGTWDFWRYPGFRTDSSIAVFRFAWHPWPHRTNMPEGHVIKEYIEDAAAAHGIDKKILFRHRVTAQTWSSDEQQWTVTVEVARGDGSVEKRVFTAPWLISASGYYRYGPPVPPDIRGLGSFGGEVVHPQSWDDSVSYAGKRVVIVGSGATAVTLLPSIAKTAASVTMLQRSPSYVASAPAFDDGIPVVRSLLPARWAGALNWWWHIILETILVGILLRFPSYGRRELIDGVRKRLPAGFDVEKHFNPRYAPFTQRLCFCPNSDFFKALRKPHVGVVTDTIETVTETGIRLASGQVLETDMIITATGLTLELLSGVAVFVDGVRVDSTLSQRYVWNGAMIEGVPNYGFINGYTAATWTPGADVRALQVIKVMKRAQRNGARSATPYLAPQEREHLPKKPLLTLSSTYVVAALDKLPVNADVGPWRIGSTWLSDRWHLTFGSMAGLRYAGSKQRDE